VCGCAAIAFTIVGLVFTLDNASLGNLVLLIGAIYAWAAWS
jgi:hypothetical protein